MPFSGFQDFNPEFGGPLQRFLAASPGITVGSGYRTPEHQAELFRAAVAKYGSERAARHWVAPAGHSQHNKGYAADLQFRDDAARQWAHDNAAKYGLGFRMGHEPWHIELAGGAGAGAEAGVSADLTNSNALLGDTLAGAVEGTDPRVDINALSSNAFNRLAGRDTGGDQPQITETRGDTAFAPLQYEQATLDPEALATPWNARKNARQDLTPLADLFDLKAIGQAGTPAVPGRRF